MDSSISERVPAQQLSVSHLFDFANSYFKQPHANANNYEAIYSLCKQLPPVSGIILEKHLSPNILRTDVSIRVNNIPAERSAYRDYIISLQGDGSFQQTGWQQVAAFFMEWCTAGSAMSRDIEHVWLEFDIVPGVTFHSIPSLFFDIDPNRQQPYFERESTLFASLTILNAVISEICQQTIQACLHTLPSEACLHYAGIMLPRNRGFIRLCFKGIPATGIIHYLDEIGWKGKTKILHHVLHKYAAGAKKLVLHIDVGESIQPEVGIELHFALPADWEAFFELAVSNGLIALEEAVQVLAYPGIEPAEQNSFGISAASIQNRIDSVKKINHVKLFLNSTGTLTMKVYLYAGM